MITTTTIYHAICNGYDKPPKIAGLCEHVDYTIIAGSCAPDRGPLWNRYHKIMGSPLLADFTVYMDGNIGLAIPACDLNVWVNRVMEGADFAAMKHPERKCAYVEVEACLGRKKITEKQARLAHDQLTASGLPKNFGLWACGVLIRRNSAPWVEDLCKAWFDEILENGVVRDQLWLPVALKKLPPPAGRFKTLDMNIWKNNVFTYARHKA